MRKIRFSIASLLVVVLFLSVGFAALRESSDLWDSGIFNLTLASLLISILLAVHRTETRRAFWIGFALFGWSYLALSLVPSIESRLITTKALVYLDSKVPGRSLGVFTAQVSSNGNKLTSSGHGQVKIWDVATGKLLSSWGGITENFVRIGHSLCAVLVGWIGGLLSRRLCRDFEAQAPSSAVDVEGINP
jgi:hypothetical protein